MNIASGITQVVCVEATQDEVINREQVLDKIKKQQPVILGSDVLGDFGIKVHFIGEPQFYELADTLVKCVVRTKLTVNEDMAKLLDIPTEINRCFTGYAKCRPGDAEKYDLEFAKKITMNKAKVNAYLYYQKMFIIKAQKLNEYIVKMVGFGKRMETLVNGNMKYVMDTCNTMYPEPEQGENVQENVPTDNAVKTNV
jgi:hypothetical protein